MASEAAQQVRERSYQSLALICASATGQLGPEG